MAIFNSYVKLPEGTRSCKPFWSFCHRVWFSKMKCKDIWTHARSFASAFVAFQCHSCKPLSLPNRNSSDGLGESFRPSALSYKTREEPAKFADRLHILNVTQTWNFVTLAVLDYDSVSVQIFCLRKALRWVPSIRNEVADEKARHSDPQLKIRAGIPQDTKNSSGRLPHKVSKSESGELRSFQELNPGDFLSTPLGTRESNSWSLLKIFLHLFALSPKK
jgi:hypothetical protein